MVDVLTRSVTAESNVGGRPAPRGRALLRPLGVFFLTLIAYGVLLAVAHPHTTGDEPHYLIIAQSIVHDGDLSLANNYANPAQVNAVYPGAGPLNPVSHAGVYRPGGPLVPVHGLGLPSLVAVVDLLGGGILAARGLMVLLTALIAPLLLITLDRLFPGRRVITTISTLATMLTAPLVFYSNQIYPDIPGALLVMVGITILVAAPRRAWSFIAGSTAAALLPWFHIRLAIFSVALAIALLAKALRSGSAAAASKGVGLHASHRLALATAVIAPLSVSAIGVLISNQLLFGSPLPNAAYRSPPFPLTLGFTSTNLKHWTIGELFSPSSGVMPLAPVLLLALAGIVLVIRRWPMWGTVGVLTVSVYYIVSTGVAAGGGLSPPGRWVVAFAPLAAIPITAALTQNWRTGIVWTVLASYSLVLSGVGATHFLSLYNSGNDAVTMPVAETFAPLWPAMGTQAATRLSLTPAAMFHAVGRSQANGTVSTSIGDGPGALVYGPPHTVLPGLYTATFPFPTVSGSPGVTVGRAELVSGTAVISSGAVVVPPAGSGATTVRLQTLTSGQQMQLRVISLGDGSMTVGGLTLAPSVPGAAGPLANPSRKPLLILWFGVVALLALLAMSGDGSKWRSRPEGYPRRSWNRKAGRQGMRQTNRPKPAVEHTAPVLPDPVSDQPRSPSLARRDHG